MKTKALSLVLVLITFRAGAERFSDFDCLRDLMPLTERGTYQPQRVDVERPFMAGDKFIVFPEVIRRKLTGFYVYNGNGAYYFDSIGTREQGVLQIKPIANLTQSKRYPLYQMTAQPGGLETVTIFYMPGFDSGQTNSAGPVYIGASVMPVIGALISRPEQYDYVYESPVEWSDGRLQAWVATQKDGRAPASAAEPIHRQVVALSTQAKRPEGRMWAPLKAELKLRREFLRDHNLDDQTFKKLREVQKRSCNE